MELYDLTKLTPKQRNLLLKINHHGKLNIIKHWVDRRVLKALENRKLAEQAEGTLNVFVTESGKAAIQAYKAKRQQPSYAMTRRQDAREHSGRYAKMHNCEACGKSIGDDYWSDHRQSGALGVHGLVLCEKCCRKMGEMTDADALDYVVNQRGKKQ